MYIYGLVRYETVEEYLFSEELGHYKTFGIRGTDASGKEVTFCSDVSANEALAHDICEKCNLFQLSPMHILDVILDSI